MNKTAKRNARRYSIFARAALMMVFAALLGLLIQGSLNAQTNTNNNNRNNNTNNNTNNNNTNNNNDNNNDNNDTIPQVISAAGTIYQQAIGGVDIDPGSVLRNAPTQMLRTRSEVLQKNLKTIPGELTQPTALRKISLKKLNELLLHCSTEGLELPDEALYLGGLTSIQHVVAIPEENDILLIGPAEGWKYDPFGCLVGVKTGRPILQLEDLITLVRLWHNNNHPEAMTCSIDPTPEALARIAQLKRNMNFRVTAEERRRELELAFGMNEVVFRGLPDNSRIARVMVAADYKLKQIGLGQPGAPNGFPSYLSYVSLRTNMMPNPRFWLTPEYGTISHDVDRLTWDLGQSKVKVMTESDYVDLRGRRIATGTSEPAATRWANYITKNYNNLSRRDSVFADLKNCMELAVAVGLIYKENLIQRAGGNFNMLWDRAAIDLPRYDVPKYVPSVGVIERKTGGAVVGCGGVGINPWVKLENTQLNEELSLRRSGLTHLSGNQFWSN